MGGVVVLLYVDHLLCAVLLRYVEALTPGRLSMASQQMIKTKSHVKV